MSSDEERLVVLLEARIRDLEKNMAKASGVTARTYREMSLGSKRATRQMEQDMVRSTSRINQALAQTSAKIGAFGKAKIGGIIGTIVAGGLTAVIAHVREVANAVAEVGDQAKMAGLSTKVFQEWKFVAEQARIPIDAITDGLKEMQLRADEFAVTGKGSAAEAFQRLGLTPQEVKESLKDPSELLLLIVERTRLLKDSAAGIRVFDELFGGTGGERMVALLDQGEQGIRAQIQAANDLGIVMDDELIKKAAEVDRKFDLIANTVGTKFKSAVVSVADSIAEMIDGLRNYEVQQSRTLENSQRAIMGQKIDISNRIKEITNGADEDSLSLMDRATVATLKSELDAANAREDLIIAELKNRSPFNSMTRTAERTWTPPAYTPPADTTSKGGGKSRAASTAATERERKAVAELIAELEEELRLVNQSDAAKRAAAAARQAGASATEEEKQKIIGLTEAIHQEEVAREKAQEQMLYYRDLTKAGLDDLFSALEQGKSFWEAMGDVAVNSLKRIGDSLIDDVLDSIFQVNNASQSGGGLLGSLLGGIFGGGSQFNIASNGGIGMYANGTNFAPSGAAIVGERGPELVNLPRGSQVVPNHALGAAMGGRGGANSGGGAIDVKVSVTVDEDGKLQAYVQSVAQRTAGQAVDRFVSSSQFPIHVGRAVEKARGRNIMKR